MSLYLVSVESKFTLNPMELFQSVKSLQKLEADLSLTELNRVLGELYPHLEDHTHDHPLYYKLKVWGMDLDRVKDSGFSVIFREFETWWILVDFSNTNMVPVKRDVLISGILD